MPTQPTTPDGSKTTTAKDGTPLNPLAVNLAKAIRVQESGGDYHAIGDKGNSHGAYQFNGDNFKSWAAQYKLDPNDFSPVNQDKVAYARINDLLSKGLAPSEVTAMWNGAHVENGKYVANNPSYTDSVKKHYEKIVGTPAQTASVALSSETPQVLGDTSKAKPKGSLVETLGNVAKGAGDVLLGAPVNLSAHLAQLAAGGTANIEDMLGFKDKAAETRARLEKPVPNILGGTTEPLKPGLGGAAQIGGDTLQTGLALAAPEVKGLGVLASKLPLLSKIPKISGALGRLAGNMGLGAGFGAANELSSGNTNPEDIKNSAETGGIFGAGLNVAGGLFGGLLNKVGARTTESRLVSQTNRLKTLDKAFKDNSTPTTNPIKTIVENKLPTPTVIEGKVNTEALSNALQSKIDDQEAAGTALVKNLDASLAPPPSLAKMQEDIIKAVQQNPMIRDAGKLPQAVSQLKRRFSSFKQSFGDNPTWEVIDNIRTAMNREFDPAERDVARTIGDVTRSYLYNGSGANTALKTAMANEAELIKAVNFTEKLHGTTVPSGRLGKYFYDMIGAMAGGAVGSIGGPMGTAGGILAGGYAADKATQLGQRAYFNPLLGSKASALEGLLQKPSAQVGTGLVKAGLLKETTKK